MVQVCGRGHVFPSLPCNLFICWPESICSPIDPEGMRRWWKSFAHLLCQRPSLITPDQMEGRFTARMRKQCGIWRRRWLPALCRTPPARSPPPEGSCGRCYDDKHGSEKRHQNGSWGDFRKTQEHTYVMPSGSKPKSLFLTSSSLGVKSGIRWILIMRSPTTWHTSQKKWELEKCLPVTHDSCFLW